MSIKEMKMSGWRKRQIVDSMSSQELSDFIYEWAINQNFNAPYGVLQGTHTNKKGNKFRAVTFGRARTLDATVEIYNTKFILLKTSNNQNAEVFNDSATLMARLESL